MRGTGAGAGHEQFGAERPVSEGRGHAFGHGGDVVGGEGGRCQLEYLGQRRRVGGEHRGAAPGGFECRQAIPLVARGEHEQRRGLVERLQERLVDVPGYHEVVGGQTASGGMFTPGTLAFGRHCTGHHQLAAGARPRRHLGERLDERLGVLAPLVARNSEDVLAPHRRSGIVHRGERVGTRCRGAERLGDAAADRHHAGRIEPEVFDPVAASVLGDGEHEVGAAHHLESGEVRLAHAWVREVALGKDQGNQVVQHDDQRIGAIETGPREHQRRRQVELDRRHHVVRERPTSLLVGEGAGRREPEQRRGREVARQPSRVRQVRVEGDRVDRGAASQQRSRELDAVARYAALAVGDALGRLQIDDDAEVVERSNGWNRSRRRG
ncbi:unannotated protein [freshwater metagenome]|uniref:Unannotated protein n=1 Tax=freshwater metagenome TaxID=449393 RepID=A0A6J6VMC0_9ZZZZ